MKKICAIICLICCMASSLCVAADDDNAKGAVNTALLYVRSAPSESATIIGSLYGNQKIDIITKTGGMWYKINYNGGVGYVAAGYVVARRNGDPQAYLPSQSSTVYIDETVYSTDTAQPAQQAPAQPEPSSKGQLVVDTAKKYLGVPYVYGGTSPSGFDCSGLVQYVFRELGVSLNRVAADQTAHGKPVTMAELLPGDIVFFHNTSRYTRINHVGIYVGGGQFIHAPQTGDVVKISSLVSGYYSTTFVTARRIFN